MKGEDMGTAQSDVEELLLPGERVSAIVFGAWGWGNGRKKLGYGEPDPPPVPFEKRGKVLTWQEAVPMMQSWSFHGGYGAPACYAVWIWTNQRVFWVTQYDGSTCLDYAPLHPMDDWPTMPGG